MVKKPVKKTSHKNIPLVVKIIAIFGYICSALTIIMGILFLAVFPAIKPMLTTALQNNAIANGQVLATFAAMTSTGMLIFGGIALLVVGVIGIIVSRGLWKARPWARMVVIIISLIGAVSALFSLEIVRLVIDLAVGLYLLLSKDVKAAFK